MWSSETEQQTNASEGRPCGQLQYGQETFVASSEFLQSVWSAPSVASRLRCVGDGKGLAASAKLFMYLPRLSISLSSSTSGQEIDDHLRRTRWGIPHTRLAQGVLVVPPTQEEYLRGHSRQAVRTNIRRAKGLGLTCRRLASPAEKRYVADHMVAQRPQPEEMAEEYRRHLDRRDSQCWTVEARDRTPAGLAVFNVDTQVAMLWSLVCLEHSAKWLLHTHVVGELGSAGVRYLLTSSRMAPVMRPRDQYVQRLLGYRVAHLSLGPPAGYGAAGSRRNGARPDVRPVIAQADPDTGGITEPGQTGDGSDFAGFPNRPLPHSSWAPSMSPPLRSEATVDVMPPEAARNRMS